MYGKILSIVTFAEYARAMGKIDYPCGIPIPSMQQIYDDVILPVVKFVNGRGRNQLYMPYNIIIPTDKEVVIKTGIKFTGKEGTHYRLVVESTGRAEDEITASGVSMDEHTGHIEVTLKNNSDEPVALYSREPFVYLDIIEVNDR